MLCVSSGCKSRPVSAGAPGSRPQARRDPRDRERGVKSLYGGSKNAGPQHEVKPAASSSLTTGEPSRSISRRRPRPTRSSPEVYARRVPPG